MNVKIGERTNPRRLHHPNRPVVRSAGIPRLVACSLQNTPRLVDQQVGSCSDGCQHHALYTAGCGAGGPCHFT
jgi:hypothetical protein